MMRFDATSLSVAQALVLNAQFTVGSVQEILQVNGGETAPIETETSQLSTLVDSKTMNDLPLLTRNAYLDGEERNIPSGARATFP